jgi:hypothetical protein
MPECSAGPHELTFIARPRDALIDDQGSLTQFLIESGLE